MINSDHDARSSKRWNFNRLLAAIQNKAESDGRLAPYPDGEGGENRPKDAAEFLNIGDQSGNPNGKIAINVINVQGSYFVQFFNMPILDLDAVIELASTIDESSESAAQKVIRTLTNLAHTISMSFSAAFRRGPSLSASNDLGESNSQQDDNPPDAQASDLPRVNIYRQDIESELQTFAGQYASTKHYNVFIPLGANIDGMTCFDLAVRSFVGDNDSTPNFDGVVVQGAPAEASAAEMSSLKEKLVRSCQLLLFMSSAKRSQNQADMPNVLLSEIRQKGEFSVVPTTESIKQWYGEDDVSCADSKAGWFERISNSQLSSSQRQCSADQYFRFYRFVTAYRKVRVHIQSAYWTHRRLQDRVKFGGKFVLGMAYRWWRGVATLGLVGLLYLVRLGGLMGAPLTFGMSAAVVFVKPVRSFLGNIFRAVLNCANLDMQFDNLMAKISKMVKSAQSEELDRRKGITAFFKNIGIRARNKARSFVTGKIQKKAQEISASMDRDLDESNTEVKKLTQENTQLTEQERRLKFIVDRANEWHDMLASSRADGLDTFNLPANPPLEQNEMRFITDNLPVNRDANGDKGYLRITVPPYAARRSELFDTLLVGKNVAKTVKTIAVEIGEADSWFSFNFFSLNKSRKQEKLAGDFYLMVTDYLKLKLEAASATSSGSASGSEQGAAGPVMVEAAVTVPNQNSAIAQLEAQAARLFRSNSMLTDIRFGSMSIFELSELYRQYQAGDENSHKQLWQALRQKDTNFNQNMAQVCALLKSWCIELCINRLIQGEIEDAELARIEGTIDAMSSAENSRSSSPENSDNLSDESVISNNNGPNENASDRESDGESASVIESDHRNDLVFRAIQKIRSNQSSVKIDVVPDDANLADGEPRADDQNSDAPSAASRVKELKMAIEVQESRLSSLASLFRQAQVFRRDASKSMARAAHIEGISQVFIELFNAPIQQIRTGRWTVTLDCAQGLQEFLSTASNTPGQTDVQDNERKGVKALVGKLLFLGWQENEEGGIIAPPLLISLLTQKGVDQVRIKQNLIGIYQSFGDLHKAQEPEGLYHEMCTRVAMWLASASNVLEMLQMKAEHVLALAWLAKQSNEQVDYAGAVVARWLYDKKWPHDKKFDLSDIGGINVASCTKINKSKAEELIDSELLPDILTSLNTVDRRRLLSDLLSLSGVPKKPDAAFGAYIDLFDRCCNAVNSEDREGAAYASFNLKTCANNLRALHDKKQDIERFSFNLGTVYYGSMCSGSDGESDEIVLPSDLKRFGGMANSSKQLLAALAGAYNFRREKQKRELPKVEGRSMEDIVSSIDLKRSFQDRLKAYDDSLFINGVAPGVNYLYGVLKAMCDGTALPPEEDKEACAFLMQTDFALINSAKRDFDEGRCDARAFRTRVIDAFYQKTAIAVTASRLGRLPGDAERLVGIINFIAQFPRAITDAEWQEIGGLFRWDFRMLRLAQDDSKRKIYNHFVSQWIRSGFRAKSSANKQRMSDLLAPEDDRGFTDERWESIQGVQYNLRAVKAIGTYKAKDCFTELCRRAEHDREQFFSSIAESSNNHDYKIRLPGVVDLLVYAEKDEKVRRSLENCGLSTGFFNCMMLQHFRLLGKMRETLCSPELLDLLEATVAKFFTWQQSGVVLGGKNIDETNIASLIWQLFNILSDLFKDSDVAQKKLQNEVNDLRNGAIIALKLLYVNRNFTGNENDAANAQSAFNVHFAARILADIEKRIITLDRRKRFYMQNKELRKQEESNQKIFVSIRDWICTIVQSQNLDFRSELKTIKPPFPKDALKSLDKKVKIEKLGDFLLAIGVDYRQYAIGTIVQLPDGCNLNADFMAQYFGLPQEKLPSISCKCFISPTESKANMLKNCCSIWADAIEIEPASGQRPAGQRPLSPDASRAAAAADANSMQLILAGAGNISGNGSGQPRPPLPNAPRVRESSEDSGAAMNIPPA